MIRPSLQAPNHVVLIRPHHFDLNPLTAKDNSFQSMEDHSSAQFLAQKAYEEVTEMAASLTRVGVKVHLFEDESCDLPDSVFPNNWFSTHPGGHIAIYPMFSPNRRGERRSDIIEMLKREYRVQDVVDYSGLEHDQLYLEGTGAMVLDHIGNIAYAARSNRTNEVILERFCTHFNFEPMVFDAVDEAGKPIYHTNVMMCIATDFALFGADLVTDARRRGEIIERLEETGREVIILTRAQIGDFAGNAIELEGAQGRVLALSCRAFSALGSDQKKQIEKSAQCLPISVPTIELAGGSVRCMCAGIHLAKRKTDTPNLFYQEIGYNGYDMQKIGAISA